MKKLAFILFCGSALWAASTTVKSKPAPAAPDDSTLDTSRTVEYRHGDVVRVRGQRHFVSTVQIRNEQIMKLVGGDNINWHCEVAETGAAFFVRPDDHAAAKASSNLVATTTSGNVYLFSLSSGEQHDESIVVIPADAAMKAAADAPPKWVDAAVVDGLKTEVASARHETDQVRADAHRKLDEQEARAREAIAQFHADYPTKLDFRYKFQANRAPFHVESVFSDGTFTYVRADPSEICALYATRDGKPALIDAAYKSGLYIVPEVLTGPFYLQIGTRKLPIKRIE